MTARKRNANESFKQYRANLKAEAKALKRRLWGTYAWVSTPNRGMTGFTYRRRKEI